MRTAANILRLMRATRRRAAFTITELLVVIGIIVLLIAIAVPAFSNLLASSERSLAVNQLKAGLAAARDAAIQSESGDGAAVFFFTPGGRVTIVSCVVVGELSDSISRSANGGPITREVLVPVSTSEPLQMPRGWGVRAFAAPATVHNPTATAGSFRQDELWYESYFASATPSAGATGWVFPETSFFSDRTADVGSGASPSGTRRQSFMVRFKAGSGELDMSSQNSALVFDPVPSTTFRSAPPFSNYRSDQLRLGGSAPAPNAATYVRRLLNHPLIPNRDLRRLLGDLSPDTVLCRPVTELALYQETHLAAGIKARGLNRVTASLYGSDSTAPNTMPLYPRIDTALWDSGAPADAAALSKRIGEWIEGGRGVTDENIAYDARIFTVQRYLGQSEEVLP